MNLTVASVVRNEADGFLETALDAWQHFADRIVILDDGSTDGTKDVLDAAGVEWHASDGSTEEWQRRSRLWNLVRDSEWVLHLDADQTMSSDPRPFLRPTQTSFRVFDLWGPDEYRDDAFWRGHKRCWWAAVHVPSLPARFEAKWPKVVAHSGHIPRNTPGVPHPTPPHCSIIHYGYATPRGREQKYAKYVSKREHLTREQWFHAKTIMTHEPRLKKLHIEVAWPLM